MLEGDDRKNFQEQLALARTVCPYIEDQNFYVEHWPHAVFWNKMREFGQIFVDNDFFDEVDDLFYLHRNEVQQALYDLIASWAVGTPARGPKYWPKEVAGARNCLPSWLSGHPNQAWVNRRKWSPK